VISCRQVAGRANVTSKLICINSSADGAIKTGAGTSLSEGSLKINKYTTQSEPGYTCTFITLIIFRLFNYFWIHMLYSLCYICYYMPYAKFLQLQKYHISVTAALTCAFALTYFCIYNTQYSTLNIQHSIYIYMCVCMYIFNILYTIFSI